MKRTEQVLTLHPMSLVSGHSSQVLERVSLLAAWHNIFSKAFLAHIEKVTIMLVNH